jgi:signal peptidase I
MKIFREVAITVLIAVAVFVLLRLTVQSYTVVMSSMEPNFQQGECIMVNKVCYRSSAPQRGQVIIFDPPFDSPHPYIKRVIGLPGETVEIKDGQVFINEIPIDEPYIFPEPPQNNKDYGPEVLSDDEYFVLGDHRNNSNDSRAGWTVPRDNIIGKAWFIYWPPSRWGAVKHYSYAGLPVLEEQEMALSQSLGVQFE